MRMKKLLSLLLVLLLVFGVSACSVDRETVDLAADLAIALLEDSDAQEPVEDPVTEEAPPSEPILDAAPVEQEESPVPETPLDAFGVYTTKEDVALYLHIYGHLPENFMTKAEARDLGWEGGGLDGYADGMCIGGDRFGNYEGLLPDAEGRTWTECDIDTLHADSRGAKRIVFSSDGLIYYTDDHYESFELLYGEEQPWN